MRSVNSFFSLFLLTPFLSLHYYFFLKGLAFFILLTSCYFGGFSSSSVIHVVTQGSAGLLTTFLWVSGGGFRPNFSLTCQMGRKKLLMGRSMCILHRKGNFMAQNGNSV